MDSYQGLRRALYCLGTNLRRHWETTPTPGSLITLLRIGLPTGRLPAMPFPIPRAYHTLPTGEYITITKVDQGALWAHYRV